MARISACATGSPDRLTTLPVIVPPFWARIPRAKRSKQPILRRTILSPDSFLARPSAQDRRSVILAQQKNRRHGLGERENHQRLIISLTRTRRDNRDVLLSALPLIRDRIRGSGVFQLRGPKLLAVLGIEGAETGIAGCADEHQATGRRDRARKRAGPSGIALLRRQKIGDAEGHLPRDLARVRIHRKQSLPGWFNTRQVPESFAVRVFVGRAETEEARAHDIGQHPCLFRLGIVPQPASSRTVLRIHEHIAGLGIRCRTAPIRSTGRPWQTNGLVHRRALALIIPRRKRARFLKPMLVPNLLARFGVFGRSVIRGDNVLARDADASERRRLQRKRLRG